jgi:hypothetical protein
MTCCQCGKKLGSPDWKLLAEGGTFHRVSMQHTWHFGGAYANWTMTITVNAPDHLDETEIAEFPLRQFDNLGRQFHDTVNLYESRRYQDDHSARAGIYGSRVY